MGISLQNLVLMDHEGTVLQPLDGCMSAYNTRRGYNEITFTTEMTIDSASVLRGGMQMEKMALIVWMDRAKAKAMLAQKTPTGMVEDHAGPLRSLMLALQEVAAVGATDAVSPDIDLQSLLDDLLKLFGVPK